MKVQIFIKGKKIDLYKDENIFYENNLQDLDNLSAVFSDSTNSFTIPATKRNNQLFNNWFEINYGLTPQFNAQKRVEAYIEIETIPYRYGRIQLESVTEKRGKVDNYKITFYSEVLNLDDLFNEDTLSDLYEFDDDLNFEWIPQNQYNLLTINDLVSDDLVIPLIFPWEGELQSNDLITEGLPVQKMRPSIRIINIIERIENKYNITFESDIFDDIKFTNLFLQLNKLEEGYLSTLYELNNTTSSISGSYNDMTINEGDFLIEVDTNGSVYTIDQNAIYESLICNTEFTILPNSGFENIPYRVRIVDTVTNKVYFEETFTGISNDKALIFGSAFPSQSDYKNSIKLELYSDFIFQCNMDFNVRIKYNSLLQPGLSIYNLTFTLAEINSDVTLTPEFSIKNNIPDFEIKDFLNSLFKLFNLIIRPISLNEFIIDTYDNYIKLGNRINLTEYLDLDNILSERKKVYKKINFNYEEGESRFNKLQLFGSGTYQFDVDSKDESDIDLNLELATFTRIINDENSRLNVYILQNEEFNEIFNDKPTIHYNLGVNLTSTNLDAPLKVNHGNNITNTTQVINVSDSSNNFIADQVTNDLNFNESLGSNYHNLSSLVDYNQYNNFYKRYFDIIYADNSRSTTLNMFLDNTVIDSLDLNTTVIIRNNQYLIEDYKVNLITGKTSLKVFPKNLIDFPLQQIGFINRLGQSQPNVNWISNIGKQFESFKYNSNSPITLEKINTGDGVDWITLEQNSYDSGLQTIKYIIDSFSIGALEDVRSCIIRVNNIHDYTITQKVV